MKQLILLLTGAAILYVAYSERKGRKDGAKAMKRIKDRKDDTLFI